MRLSYHTTSFCAISIFQTRPKQEGRPPAGEGGLPPLKPSEDSAPVDSNMKAHEAEAPISADHVQCPGKAGSSRNGQERKYFFGQNDTTDHQPQHHQKQYEIDRSQKGPGQTPTSFCQPSIPAYIQSMMSQKQNPHSSSQPLMSGFAYQRIGHQG